MSVALVLYTLNSRRTYDASTLSPKYRCIPLSGIFHCFPRDAFSTPGSYPVEISDPGISLCYLHGIWPPRDSPGRDSTTTGFNGILCTGFTIATTRFDGIICAASGHLGGSCHRRINPEEWLENFHASPGVSFKTYNMKHNPETRHINTRNPTLVRTSVRWIRDLS